ncbi:MULTISPECIES: hypothetical protein [unclassified Paenibacillus]|uniref:hypothetical protein n=1 Tax=unclassified Paenibacillus TaxID=185978 RepID=UPI00247663DF|nr:MULTISPECIES: hypothetical protein [unclassified Paenibacillus]
MSECGGAADMRGKSAFDLSEYGGVVRKRGKSALDLSECGGLAEIRGKRDHAPSSSLYFQPTYV